MGKGKKAASAKTASTAEIVPEEEPVVTET
jgi:hypothetical protein